MSLGMRVKCVATPVALTAVLRAAKIKRSNVRTLLRASVLLTVSMALTAGVAEGQYRFKPIAVSGELCAPDFASGAALNNDGTAAFFDSCSRILSGNGERPHAVLFDLYQQSQQICNQVSCFFGFGSTKLSINNKGEVATHLGRFKNSTGEFFDTIIVFGGVGPTIVLDTEGSEFNGLRLPVINDTGAIAVEGWLATGSRIARVAGGLVQSVAETGQPSPYGSFGQVFFPAINNSGQVAFFGNLSAGSGAVFLESGGILTGVASVGGNAFPSLGDDGAVAFLGSGRIQLASGGSLSVVAEVATANPDSPFVRLGQPSVNGDGSVAFWATLANGVTGIYTGSDPVRDKVVEAGDALPGGYRADSLKVTPEAINDIGQIVFSLSGPAGNAIFRADPPGSTPDNPVVANPDNPTRLPVIVSPVRSRFAFFFDPPIATGYRYTAGSGVENFTTVVIPRPLPGGDATFEVRFEGFAETLVAGVPFDFQSTVPGGVREFTIVGIDVAEALDPDDPRAFVTGLTFAGASNGTMTMTPLVGGGDSTPPTLSVPTDFAVNATSPTGARVTYSVSATDDSDPAPIVTCDTASGAVFPVGVETVSCTASDSAGNSTEASFHVTVQGAAVQIANLKQLVTGLVGVTSALRNALSSKLETAEQALIGGDLGRACDSLRAFINEVRAKSGKSLTAPQTTQMTDEATRIRAVIGCS